MSVITDETKFEAEEDNDITITCKHGKKIIVSVESNSIYCWDDGAHIETKGCQECAKENNMNFVR